MTSDSVQNLSDPNASVGVMLSGAREHLGYSLAEVATVTRIPRNMLENLEQDRFAEYSASVFARGHLSSYARELRLDPLKVMQAYDRQIGRPAKKAMPVDAPAKSVVKVPTAHAPRTTTPKRKHVPARASARWNQARFGKLAEVLRPRQMAGLVLILCALFAAVSIINGNRATAQDPSAFPEASAKESWGGDRDVQKTRWLLEQPASLSTQNLKP